LTLIHQTNYSLGRVTRNRENMTYARGLARVLAGKPKNSLAAVIRTGRAVVYRP
jgi:hypothetical protein